MTHPQGGCWADSPWMEEWVWGPLLHPADRSSYARTMGSEVTVAYPSVLTVFYEVGAGADCRCTVEVCRSCQSRSLSLPIYDVGLTVPSVKAEGGDYPGEPWADRYFGGSICGPYALVGVPAESWTLEDDDGGFSYTLESAAAIHGTPNGTITAFSPWEIVELGALEDEFVVEVSALIDDIQSGVIRAVDGAWHLTATLIQKDSRCVHQFHQMRREQARRWQHMLKEVNDPCGSSQLSRLELEFSDSSRAPQAQAGSSAA